MDGDDIQLILKQYNEKFITHGISLGIYSIKDFADAVYTVGGHEGTLKTEDDDITRKTKPILDRFGLTFGTLRFDEKSFLVTLLGFEPYWDYWPTNAIHADSPGVYAGDKFLNMKTTDKIHSKCDVIDGSVLHGFRQPILFSFDLGKQPGFNVFCEPETIQDKKTNKPV